MIISKRSHLNKLETEKPLLALIDSICLLENGALARKLKENLKWDRPRGDLLHWIRVLNFFDEILEKQIEKYGLAQEHPKLREIAPEDAEVILACLQFSTMLLEHCANRALYLSSERIYLLINAYSVDVRLAALEVAVCLGERYIQSSHSKKCAAPKPTRLAALEIAKAFPPPVPASFLQKRHENDDASLKSKNEHYSLIDTLDHKKKHPSKWKGLTFQYYSAKKKDKKDQTEEGVVTFTLADDAIRKMTLEQIYDKASECLPAETWFSFSLAAMNAKAFNTRLYDSMKLRAKLLRIKCMAIGFVCSVCTHDFTSSNLFEAEPYILSFLIDLISPEHASIVSSDVFYSAVKALECISMKRIWGSELVRNLGGNVSHGLLYQLMRHINKKVKNEDEDCYEKGYLHFFTLLGNLVDSKSLTPRLAAGGLLSDLMSFLNLHTKYRWTCSAAVNTIFIFLNASPESIVDFANADGFRLLIETINYEVNFALEHPDFGGGAPTDTIVYYKITLRQVNYLRNLLKLVSHLIQSNAGDRLRNLFDSSILVSFNKIVCNPTIFGPFVLASTLDAVLYIVHNEPTAFSILKEANVIDTILTNYESLFMPSSELLMSLLEVLGAISLNKEGLQKVTESGVLKIYFKSFLNLQYAKELMRADMNTNIGCSMDELGRHYPTLRPLILAELALLIDEFPAYADKHLQSIRFYTSKSGALYNSPKEEVVQLEDGQLEIERWEATDGSNLIDNLFGFLSGLLQDSGQWGKECIKDIRFSSWAKFLTLSNTPFDYTTSDGIMNLMGIFKYLDDEDREYGFPDLFKILPELLASQRVQDFIHSDSKVSYFERFENDADAGTALLKELNAINAILYTLTEIHLDPSLMFNERYLSLIQCLGVDPYPLIHDLTLLLGRSSIEEIIIRSKLPNEVIELTAPVLEPNNDIPPLQIFSKQPTLHIATQDVYTSAKYKNTLQLRFLNDRIQHHIVLIFSCVSRTCMQRRQDYFNDQWRRTSVIATKYLASQLSSMFNRLKVLDPKHIANYNMIATNNILFVAMCKDKGKEIFSTALVLDFFFHTDLMSKIVDAAIVAFNDLLALPKDEMEKVKKLSFICNTEGSIKVNFLNQVLLFLFRFLSHGFVAKYSFSFLFYYKDYCSSDTAITEGIVTQAALLAVKLVRETIGSKSIMKENGSYSLFAKFPFPIADQLVSIVRLIGEVEPVDDYYPLKEDWMTPPYDQVKLITETVGISHKSATSILQLGKDLKSVIPEDLSKDVSVTQWEQCKDLLASQDYKDWFKYEPISTGAQQTFNSMWETESKDLLSSTLLELAANIKSLDRTVALTVKDKGNEEVIYEKLLETIRRLSTEKTDYSLQCLANCVDLLGKLINQEHFVTASKLHDIRQEVFYSFLNFFVEEMENHPDLASTDYFVAGLTLIEPILSQTTPNLLEEVQPYFPSLTADFVLKDRVINAILQLDPRKSLQSATALCKLMYLFAKEEIFKKKVASSQLLKTIIQSAKTYLDDEEGESYKVLQEALILVIRVCFEHTQTVENIMSSEITKHFKKQSGGRKDLRRLLDESRHLIARDPQVFIDTASKMVRLESFNGKPYTGDAVFLLESDGKDKASEDVKEQGSEDVEMEDPQNVPEEIPTTGLIRFLLTQLMEAAKGDWVTGAEAEVKPSPEVKKKKELQFEILMKNRTFAYMCFLLQTITELIGSYKNAKLEFITYSKKDTCEDKKKPRSTSLNFFIHQLIPSQSLLNSSGPEFQRREAISSLSKLAVLALVSTPVLKNDEVPDPKKEDVDLAILRRFLVNILLKVLKETLPSPSVATLSYSKLYDLFDLCGCLLSSKFRDLCYPLLNKNATKMDQFYLASAFIEMQLPSQIAAVIADADLNFPNVNRVVKVGLKPLSHLAKIKLGFADLFESHSPGDKEDDDLVPDDDEDRDETPDLFRNSTLGMYDVDFDSEDSEDYYDEGGPMEVLMSDSDLSQEDSDSEGSSDSDSDLVSESDEDDEMMDDAERAEQAELEGYDSDDSENDIEIIDELDIHSESGSDSDDAGSDASDFYGFENEVLSEGELEEEDEDVDYNDEELDGWIEAFEEADDMSEEDAQYNFQDRFSDRPGEDYPVDINSEEDNNLGTEEESNFESDGEDVDNEEEHGARRTREFVTSFFDALRPTMGQQNVSSLFGLFDGRDLLRESLQIRGNSRNNYQLVPRFERAFEVILNDKQNGIPKNSLNYMFIRSSTERWKDAFAYFFRSFEMKFVECVRAQIFEKISEDSLEIYRKKTEERDKVRREREEKIRKRREEVKRRREEEARQRELELANNPPPQREPVTLRIGDREVDISGTDIDPEFFEALPDDMREEVFTQHVRERRANATSTGSEVREIDPDFLDALPEQIREEIMQQESLARRFSEGGFRYLEDDEAEDEDLEGEESDDAERLNLANSTSIVVGADTTGGEQKSEEAIKKRKTFATPLIDRAGVASLIRLLFIPQPINQREQIYVTLSHVCNNRQTGTEVMSLLIAVLHEGLLSQKSLEKIYIQISGRANNTKTASQPLLNKTFPIGATPVIIGVQIIEAVFYLLEKNIALRYFLLSEHENVFVSKRNKKNKLKEPSNEDKYPINYLLKLLDNPLLNEEHFFVDLLANVLQIGTRPLGILRGSHKTPPPPPISTKAIPDANLKLIIRILCSSECANTTFRRTISAMQNLSIMEKAQSVFSKELSNQASDLGRRIIKDLKELTNDLLKNPSYDTDSKSFSSFTASSSDQAKLLRILTALDYMFETTNKKGKLSEDALTERKEIDQLTGLYKHLELGSLWDALSDCLRVLEDNLDLANVATALLPMIEALMVVCKHSKVKELQIKDVMKYEAKKIDFTKEPIESLFFSFTDEHKKILNQMVRTNPNLMSGPFSMLVRNPKVLEFDNKKNYFDRQLHEDVANNNKLSISIRRDQVFLDSYRALFFKSVDEFRNLKLEINFKGEAGIDAGGVTREWYQVLSRQMFNPDYALFTAVASDETTFHPNRTSYINPEHLSFFKFIGRIIGKAIFDNSFLDCHFSRAVYKNILDRSVSLKDMENLDLEYFKSLMWMLENDITDIITEDFSVETDDYGEHKTIDLIPDGRNIPVTEENKQEYVRLIVEYRLQTSVAEQMNNFIIGFHEIIPKDLVAIFDEQELELLISGLPDIDVADWQNNSTYNNYSPSSEQIQWFWRAVKSFDNEERAKLLQFATGTSKVPLNGFKELRGANGGCKFSIHRDYGSTERLPLSHTCFNQVDLPAYETYETLRGSLLLAITEGHEGFGLA